jgi:hypothetical protein
MLSLDDHDGTTGIQVLVQGIGDLNGKLFLELGSAGVALDESRQLG